METNQDYKTVYLQKLEKLRLPENPQDSDQYDWCIAREFCNLQKQIHENPDYILSSNEFEKLAQLECYIILRGLSEVRGIDRHAGIGLLKNLLEQRMRIRDEALTPGNFCQIDERMPTELLSRDEVARAWQVIHPGREYHEIPLPIDNYMANVQLPSEIIVRSTEPVGETEKSAVENHLPMNDWGQFAKALINEISQAYRVNRDVIASIILVAVGAASNRKTTVKSWNYINSPCFWLSIVERTGGGKSEPMSRLMRPLEEINKSLVREYNRAYAEFVGAGSKGLAPARKKILISDSTPEVRNSLMVTNGLLLMRDELNGFFKDIGRYASSGEVENLLSTWSGQGFPVDRVSAASFEVENPFLSIIGGIQPKIMAEAFGSKGFAESGFIPRWLYVVPKETKVPDSVCEKLIDRNLENEWYSLITSLWRMESREFRLSGTAKISYQAYMRDTARIMNSPDCEDATRAMYAKLRIYALRFALTIHLLKNGAKAADEISGQTMDSAIRTCNAFAGWNRQALSMISGSEAQKSLSNAQLLRLLCERYNVKNQSELARLIGRSQQYVCRVLGNDDKQSYG